MDIHTPTLTPGARPHLVLSALAAAGTMHPRELKPIAAAGVAPEAQNEIVGKALRRLYELRAACLTCTGSVRITDTGRQLLARTEGHAPSVQRSTYVGVPAAPRDRSWTLQPCVSPSREPCMRAGAFDFRKHPSRISGCLVYRDGRKEIAR
ncbi:hypothetical protein [Eleftheria terrae]|uniref:hypothetical protein n=1 Tax=Eleftheria terrae TaxID=1597781 RepID=UPI00263B5437|nr:hypothetical protein [Eleftheria terrae]WKB52290.1 hypothetical protein N7L95_21240 [Eleftheria terrae]